MSRGSVKAAARSRFHRRCSTRFCISRRDMRRKAFAVTSVLLCRDCDRLYGPGSADIPIVIKIPLVLSPSLSPATVPPPINCGRARARNALAIGASDGIPRNSCVLFSIGGYYVRLIYRSRRRLSRLSFPPPPAVHWRRGGSRSTVEIDDNHTYMDCTYARIN